MDGAAGGIDPVLEFGEIGRVAGRGMPEGVLLLVAEGVLVLAGSHRQHRLTVRSLPMRILCEKVHLSYSRYHL